MASIFPWTHDTFASASWVLWLYMCTFMLFLNLIFWKEYAHLWEKEKIWEITLNIPYFILLQEVLEERRQAVQLYWTHAPLFSLICLPCPHLCTMKHSCRVLRAASQPTLSRADIWPLEAGNAMQQGHTKPVTFLASISDSQVAGQTLEHPHSRESHIPLKGCRLKVLTSPVFPSLNGSTEGRKTDST